MTDIAQKYKDKAIKQVNAGQWLKALPLCRKAVQINPHDKESCRLLALCYLQTGQLDQAEKVIQKVVQKHPDDIPAWLNSASVAQARGQWSLARQRLQQALQRDSTNPVAYFNLGNSWVAEACLVEAARAYTQAVQLRPGYWQAWLNLGQVQKSLGDSEHAAESYRQALRFQPTATAAYLGLANLKGGFLDAADADRLKRIISRAKGCRQGIEAAFALGEYHHSQADWAAAAHCWKQANHWSWNRLSSAQKKNCVPSLEAIERLDRAKLETLWQDCQAKVPKDTVSQPVFVVGMPRSGTTLVEQILASHSQVNGASELPFVPEIIGAMRSQYRVSSSIELLNQVPVAQWQDSGIRYLEKTHRWQDKPWFVDKLPENLEFIGQILFMLPQAKIVVCQRDPRATALSNFRQHYARGRHWSYSMPAIFRYWHYQQAILSVWQTVFTEKIHRIDYENLVVNLPAEVERLNRFLGLEGQSSQQQPHLTRREIRTASAGQVSQPVHQSSLKLWEKYDRWLDLTDCWTEMAKTMPEL